MDAVTSISPPAGAAKLSATVSIRPDVHDPPESSAVMFRWPLPSSDTLAVELVSVSPVPQFPVQPVPEYWVPMSSVQLESTPDPAAPEKLSLNAVVQPDGGDGTVVADADGAAPMT